MYNKIVGYVYRCVGTSVQVCVVYMCGEMYAGGETCTGTCMWGKCVHVCGIYVYRGMTDMCKSVWEIC